jgi:hypothetical protein
MFTEQEVVELANRAAAVPFRPMATYDAETDCLEFLASNESYYAQPIDALVTLYCSHGTDTPVGLRLKKVKKFFNEFLKKSPGFRTEFADHRIKVEHLFTAKIWASEDPNDVRVITYRMLRDIAKSNNVEADIGDLAELVA